MQEWNGKSLIRRDPDISIKSDTSRMGCGASMTTRGEPKFQVQHWRTMMDQCIWPWPLFNLKTISKDTTIEYVFDQSCTTAVYIMVNCWEDHVT